MKDALLAYGLNRNEMEVFLTLVHLGGAYVKDLVEKTKFHKNIVYDNLYKLKDKGLVSEILIENTKYFQCENPAVIEEFMQEKKAELESHQKEINQLKETIATTRRLPSKTVARMYTGIQGVKQIFALELEVGSNYCVLGAPEASVQLFGEHFWKNFVSKQKEKGIQGKIIFNESLRRFSEEIDSSVNKIRFLEKASEPLTETIIFGKYVAIVVWTDEPVATLIESKEVAQSYRTHFDILWELAKK